jgi:signal transduction histidine kinase
MTKALQQVIDSLRHEVQQYGEMLALLEAQQDVVTQREPQSVLTSIATVESQSVAIGKARQDRETAQSQLAWALGWSDKNHSFQQLLPLLPGEYRPLVAALVEEINELLRRVRERAEQNHAQLRRALELMERFISTISLQAQTTLLVGEQPPSDAEPPPFLSAIA